MLPEIEDLTITETVVSSSLNDVERSFRRLVGFPKTDPTAVVECWSASESDRDQALETLLFGIRRLVFKDPKDPKNVYAGRASSRQVAMTCK